MKLRLTDEDRARLASLDTSKMPEWATPEEVAKLTGLSLPFVLQMIRTGKVRTKRIVPRCHPRSRASRTSNLSGSGEVVNV